MNKIKTLIATAALACAGFAHAGALDFDNSEWDQATNVVEAGKTGYYRVSINTRLARQEVQSCYAAMPKDSYSNIAERCLALDVAVYAAEIGQINQGAMVPDLYFSKANVEKRRDATLALFGATKDETDLYYGKLVQAAQGGLMMAMLGK